MSPFLHDLITLVRTSMLRMKPEERSDCGVIVSKLTAIREKCDTDETYTKPRNWSALRTPTDLSTISSFNLGDSRALRPPFSRTQGGSSRPGTPETPRGGVSVLSTPDQSPKKRTSLPTVRESDPSKRQENFKAPPVALRHGSPSSRGLFISQNSDGRDDKTSRLHQPGGQAGEPQPSAQTAPSVPLPNPTEKDVPHSPPNEELDVIAPPQSSAQPVEAKQNQQQKPGQQDEAPALEEASFQERWRAMMTPACQRWLCCCIGVRLGQAGQPPNGSNWI